MYLVKATVAPGSSDEGLNFTVGLFKTLEDAQWGALRNFCEDWAQDDWDSYDNDLLLQFREALVERNPAKALELQSDMSGYEISVEEIEICDPVAEFDIEDQFA